MKAWYKSKTNRAMALALVASILSGVFGQTWLDGELQVAIVSLVGLILRKFTKEPVDW